VQAVSLEPDRLSIASQAWSVLKETADEWSKDNCSRLAAALSYYALLSLAPLLLLMVALVGLVFGEEGAREQVVQAMASVMGPQGLNAIETMADSAAMTRSGPLGSLIGVGIALFAASSAFVELQASLNTVWEIQPKRDAFIRSYALERFWSFLMVLGVSLVLLLSLLSSAVLAIVGEFFEHALPGGGTLWQVVNFFVSLSLITLVFAALFKLVPDVELRWTDVSLGAFLTGLLFVVGNLLLGVYLRTSGVTSSFGGAGSVVALMIWVYYSAQLVFLGAEFTQVYTRRFGSQRKAAGTDKPTASPGPSTPRPSDPSAQPG
jgi:membrane protein